MAAAIMKAAAAAAAVAAKMAKISEANRYQRKA
jgi:hypothetical protein